MVKFRTSVRLFALLTFALGLSAAAHAQTRTWVDGVGDDINPCSRTAPCKTFAKAISVTATHGEINVITPGSFGTVTVTKSITIDGGSGVIAGITNVSANGVTVLDSEVHHNGIGLFVGTGTTLKLGGSAVNQNSSNFSNGGTVQSFCDNSTESATIPGAVTNICLH
jgi:hypothetical protein